LAIFKLEGWKIQVKFTICWHIFDLRRNANSTSQDFSWCKSA